VVNHHERLEEVVIHHEDDCGRNDETSNHEEEGHDQHFATFPRVVVFEHGADAHAQLHLLFVELKGRPSMRELPEPGLTAEVDQEPCGHRDQDYRGDDAHD